MLYSSELFSCCWKSLLKLKGTNLKERHFLLVETLIFLPEEVQFFATVETYFLFKRMLLPGSGNGFSGYYKPFLHIFSRFLPVKADLWFSGNVFLNESFIPAIRK